MKKILVISFVLVTVVAISIGCRQEPKGEPGLGVPVLPASLYDYSSLTVPEGVLTRHSDNEPFDNLTTDAGATLGRVLFYDRRMSKNNRIACASCHLQKDGFSDGLAFSNGYGGRKTGRNSPPILNLRFQEGFFWDNRAPTLERQVLMPIQDHIEMGMERIEDLPAKLAEEDYYGPLFSAAFNNPVPVIDTTNISRALAQFIRSMWSFESKFDKGVAVDFTNYSAQEFRGKELFFEELHCGSCHQWGAFHPSYANSGSNIGLSIHYKDNATSGIFKVPSLRNVELTGPYMHDGSFETLEQIVEHYNSGVQLHPSLDWRLREVVEIPGGGYEEVPLRLNLSKNDKQALVAFMKTLTDRSFTTDPKFSDPFR